jgi:hypothetical protein
VRDGHKSDIGQGHVGGRVQCEQIAQLPRLTVAAVEEDMAVALPAARLLALDRTPVRQETRHRGEPGENRMYDITGTRRNGRKAGAHQQGGEVRAISLSHERARCEQLLPQHAGHLGSKRGRGLCSNRAEGQ